MSALKLSFIFQFEDFFWCPASVKLPSGEVQNDIPEGPTPYNFLHSGGLRYEADHAFKCIRNGMFYNITVDSGFSFL